MVFLKVVFLNFDETYLTLFLFLRYSIVQLQIAKSMGITEVKAYLDSKDALTNLILLQESAATVSEAARALKCNEDQIAKSIAFYSGDHKQAILIVSSGKSKIDNKAFKKEFGFKPKMLSTQDLEKLVGHPVGGVCPFATLPTTLIYFDTSLQKHNLFYPAGGNAYSAVIVTKENLDILCQFERWITVTR